LAAVRGLNPDSVTDSHEGDCDGLANPAVAVTMTVRQKEIPAWRSDGASRWFARDPSGVLDGHEESDCDL
jgi:hypothetical protein